MNTYHVILALPDAEHLDQVDVDQFHIGTPALATPSAPWSALVDLRAL